MSERAKNIIKDLCKDDVEFLPFHDLNGKAYFAINVLRVCEVLDINRCDTIKYDNSDEIITINTYAFKDDLSKIPPMFKDPSALNTIFVTEEFAKLAIKNKLTGLALADPSVNQFDLVVSGSNPNVVDGIIT